MKIQLILTTILLSTFVSAQSDTYQYHCLRVEDCQNSATCNHETGACECTSGYGNFDCGVLETSPTCTNLTCNNGGTCYTLNSVDTCVCAYGYRGDTCDETDFQIVCSGNKAEFKIYLPTQFDGSVQLRKDNALADESCVIQEDTTDDYKLYSIAVDISDTGTDAATPCKRSELTVGEQDGEPYYEATILVRYDIGITSILDVIYKGNCTHKLESQMGKDLTSMQLDNNNLSSINEGKEHRPLDMVLLDENGNVLESSSVLYVGSVIKFVSYITDSEAFKTVRFDRCVANNTLEGDDNKEFVLFDGGCPTARSKRFTAEQIHENYTNDDGEHPAASFSLDAFKFADTNNIGILCTAKVCKADSDKCDVPTDCDTVRSELLTTTTTTTTPAATTTVPPSVRKRRAADDNIPDTLDNETLSAIITIRGPNDANDLSKRTSGIDQLSATVENCFTRSEIFAVVTVLASIVCILLIACLILGCLIIKRKSKSTQFESMPAPPSDRYRIPRAHVNDAFTMREV